MTKKLKLGLALGSGSARGWSHIGVLKALATQNIHPDIVCGTSIGALVAASYVCNNINKLEERVRSLSTFDIARFFELNRSLNGFVNQQRLHKFLNTYVASDVTLIENSMKQYASVSTELTSGREIWHLEGSVVEAVLASISMPGLFPAIKNANRWLVDGGLVNPVPVSVCKALGADVVIAVNLNGDLVGKHFNNIKDKETSNTGFSNKVAGFLKDYTGSLLPMTKDKEQPPGLIDAIAGSVNITQDRITRSRLAGDPPDILLAPKLSRVGLLEFYRASETIEEGEKCVARALPEIKEALGIT